LLYKQVIQVSTRASEATGPGIGLSTPWQNFSRRPCI